MDGFTLRCNNLRCRSSIDTQAIVTTCWYCLAALACYISKQTIAMFSVFPVVTLYASPSRHPTSPAVALPVTPFWQLRTTVLSAS